MVCSISVAVGPPPSPAASFTTSASKASSTSRCHNLLRPTAFHVPWRHSSMPSSQEESGGHLDHKISLSIIDRREVVMSSIRLLASVLLNISADRGVAVASEFADMPALKGKDYGKTKMRYPDYIETKSGLQYKNAGLENRKWAHTKARGNSSGYYGRIFEARNKTKGGSFEGDDKAFYKFRLGYQEVIPAFEEAVAGMSLGGIRRIIVPPELGYPENDFNKSGPRPTTFSGQRALDFVLRNQGLIDKTLLFDIELLKVIPT